MQRRGLSSKKGQATLMGRSSRASTNALTNVLRRKTREESTADCFFVEPVDIFHRHRQRGIALVRRHRVCGPPRRQNAAPAVGVTYPRLCVPKTKSGRSGDEVRQAVRVI